ncbi:MAG: hypothetical protein ACOCXG_04475 [Nanoarchaeota archaeon]
MVKQNKKGSAGLIILMFMILLVLIFIVIGIFMMAGSPLSGNSDIGSKDYKATLSDVDISLGTDVDGNHEKIRIDDTDLDTSDVTLELNLTYERDDQFEDLTSAGQRFKVVVEVLNENGYTSWNDSVTTKQYFIDYSSSSDDYSVVLNSGTSGDLDSIVSISSSVTVPVEITLNTESEFHNIVENQYDSKNIAKISIYSPDGETLLDSIDIEYIRTTA